MYENDYAGTMTGSTAARLAGKSAREAGYKKSKLLDEMLMSQDEAIIKKDAYRNDAMGKQWDVYDQVRFAPVHGHGPARDFELEAAPSRAGMYVSMAQSVLGGISSLTELKAPPTGSKKKKVGGGGGGKTITKPRQGTTFSGLNQGYQYHYEQFDAAGGG